MSQVITHNTMLMCDLGTMPNELKVVDPTRPLSSGAAVGLVTDTMPGANIGLFAGCSAPQGTGICAFAPIDDWSGTDKATVGGIAVLTDASTCQCALGGEVSVSQPGDPASTVKE